MQQKIKYLLAITSAILILGSLYSRYNGLKFISFDVINFVFLWYEYIGHHGVAEALKHDFSNYNYSIPYIYLIGIAESTSSFLNRGSYIKLIGFAFDIYCSFIVYKLVFHKHKDHFISIFAGSLFFALPTVILNSGYWGQADNIYTAFLLTCLYFVLKDRSAWAVIAWGLAFSFKLQAIFMLPFLFLAVLVRKIKWRHIPLAPLPYLALVLPAVILGRPINSIFDAYIVQSGNSLNWIYNSPSIYALFQSLLPEESPDMFVLPVVGLLLLGWVIFSLKKYIQDNDNYIVATALISVTLTPYLLPHMHERYFFQSDALSLVFAFYVPAFVVVAAFFQLSSYFVYSNYLFYEVKNDAQRLIWAAILNLISLIMLIVWQASPAIFEKIKTYIPFPASKEQR